jgi:hypothetical protein
MKILRIIGSRPTQAPEGWEVYNAPRPIYGTVSWTGDFRHGSFYVAIDPKDERASFMIKENNLLRAYRLEYVSKEAVIKEVEAELKAEYPDLPEKKYTEEVILQHWQYVQQKRMDKEV